MLSISLPALGKVWGLKGILGEAEEEKEAVRGMYHHSCLCAWSHQVKGLSGASLPGAHPTIHVLTAWLPAATAFPGRRPPWHVHNSLLVNLRSNMGTPVPNPTGSIQELVPESAWQLTSLEDSQQLDSWKPFGIWLQVAPSQLFTHQHLHASSERSSWVLADINRHKFPGTAICWVEIPCQHTSTHLNQTQNASMILKIL